jgi:DNA-binding transcriptional LysR family regulator
MRFFEVCARQATFAAAADELCVSQSAVSKQIKNLEEGLGFTLFVRDSKNTKLTGEGSILAKHLTELFYDLDTLIEDLADSKTPAPLIISCEPTICLKLLIPCLSIIEQQTGIAIQVLSAGGPINLRRDHADLAIRRNDFNIAQGLDVFPLGDEYVGPVITLETTDVNEMTKSNTTRIHSQTRPHAWDNWQSNHPHSFTEDVYHERHFLALEAAESGQGAAMMSIHMVSRLLEMNKLSAPFGFTADGSKYIVLSANAIALDERKLRICQWLQQRFERNAQQALEINASLADE